ncbi:short-chain dehydrogenase/reductase SDR [Candidatus Koribacter versatilis Ellin345]|uniref:Short-chain dehydrogenase/reductase SDR n=1 Tax=Koribacter versatilis (strain Ellin345) TaxID=204669 RepID=Q1ILJ4_KORVE|nr:SDR family NAD(P)-dependent oxidoreductase [Candidatus Koribacter versatilis]ABF42256.1 short-chain dehydrogenase/reductase SDR [Candidatus Koribacter versatilis Ellin345]
MKLKDQIAVITGGSMGIGEAIAKLFVNEGAKVVLCSREAARCEEARQRIGHPEQTVALACDVRNRASIDALIMAVLARFGRIDIWINNAGYGLLDSTENLDLTAARELFDTNLWGAVQGMQAVIPAMQRQRSGVIANVSSAAGYIGVPYMPAYCASKHALNAISHTSRLELDQYGIAIVSVCPGYVQTEFGKNAVKGSDSRRVGGSTKHGITADRVARAVLRGCVKKSREIVVPWYYRPLFVTYSMWPGLIETMLRKSVRKI